MIKQFNFYDIYGYLLPGMLLTVLLWAPIGLLTGDWPQPDISKSLFLAALAYVLGHLIQSVAAYVVPSKVRDGKKNWRRPSDMFFDDDGTKKTSDKSAADRVAELVQSFLNISVRPHSYSDGNDQTATDRDSAFRQARAYLIAKKAASYVEQYQGLYSMMRGFACSFAVAAAYFAGWLLAFRGYYCPLRISVEIVASVASTATLVFSLLHIQKKENEWNGRTPRRLFSAFFLLGFIGAGFWVGASEPNAFWNNIPAHAALILLGGVLLMLIAAARCYKSYRIFAKHFALAVWNDFSSVVVFDGETGLK